MATWHPTKEIRERMSKSHLGKKLSNDHVMRIMLGRKSYKHSEESKRKLSEIAKKRGQGPLKGIKGMLGKKMTPEFCQAVSNRQMGEKNHQWKGGYSMFLYRKLKEKEKVAGRAKPKQCEVCGSLGTISFDHDHTTGQFRGWICRRCNLVLGFVKDDSELLIMLSKYLQALHE